MADEVLEFRIGRSNREHLILRPTRREFPEATDRWDANWIYTTIEISARSFRGHYEATLEAGDFVRLHQGLDALYTDLPGKVLFEPAERWLRMDVTGDGKGHFVAECEARDDPGMGPRLAFTLEFDQTELPAMVRALGAICRAFPIRGA